MSFATRHNKGNKFDIDTEGFKYFSLKELFDEFGEDYIHGLQGIYINRKSEYGDAPVAILTDRFANLPSHLLEECQEILNSDEDVAEIKAGKVGFSIYPYQKEDRKGKMQTYYSIRWEDM